MKNKLRFKDYSDSISGLNWMLIFLKKEEEVIHKNENPELIAEEIEETRMLIKNILSTLNNKQGFDLLNYNTIDNIWQSLIFLNDDTFANQREPEPISWGIWRIEKKQEFDFGYTKESIYKVFVPENSDQKIHFYKSIPPKIVWNLKKINQKGNIFYISSARVDQIEQVSSVPALPKEITSIEAGLRVLDKQRGVNEWQRRPMPKRIQSITEFAEFDTNVIANAPILYLNEKSTAKIHEDTLEINFDSFLKFNESESEKYYSDHEITDFKIESFNNLDSNYIDLRPVWLIDGQHRVRGLSKSEIGSKLEIPIIILPSEFGLHNAAKVFSEINTLQESLKPLHKLFMQHRFQIPSPNTKRDFTSWVANPENHIDSRANHMSYELISRLASNDDSILRNKVKILEQNDTADYYVKADQWVNYARSWFLSGGPYSNIVIWNDRRDIDIYTEVNSYFTAFIETVNHDAWKDKKERWPKTARNKSLLQSSTHFKVLIDLYSEVYLRINKSNSVKTVDDFKKVLVPFKHVDWLNIELKKMFGGGGEKGRTSLYIWMFDALKSKESHPVKSVMSKNIKSEPGKGILAPPMKSEIKVEGKWPSKVSSVIFKSERPINARKKPTWTISDDKHETYNDILKIRNNNECTLDFNQFMNNIKSFRITVIWSNASNTNGTSFIDIYNPNLK